MSWLKQDLQFLSHTAEEEWYEALSTAPNPDQSGGSTVERGEWLRSNEEGSQAHGFALHRAAFDGNDDELRRLLSVMTHHQKLQLDPQGNTALHVAVLRHRLEAIRLLLAAGVPADVKNARLWNPIDESVALKDAEATKIMYTQLLADAKRAKKEKKKQLVAIMEQLQDFKMQLRWELGSPLFGLLLRHYAPDDTYHIYKVGNLLRVDGTLMGLDDKAHTLIPRWKRGHFSLLVNAGVSPTAAFLVDHTTRVYYDLYKERKAHLKGVDQDVRDMLAEGAGKVRMADADFDFKPVKTWLGWPAKEKVEGWETEVFEACGSLVAATWQKAAVVVPPGASYDDYLAMELPPDHVEEVPVDPYSPPAKPPPLPAAAAPEPAGPAATAAAAATAAGTSAGGHDVKRTPGSPSLPAAASGSKKHKAKAKRFSSRCWLARHYPISLAQMIPLLEVVAAGNKHFAQAADYLRQFKSEEYFPIRTQVPLVWTVHLLLSFRHFSLIQPGDEALKPGFFELPAGYSLDRMEEGDLVQKKGGALLERLDSGEAPPPK